MLSGPESFEKVEKELRAMGTIASFEADNGPVLGRVMILTTEIPSSIPVKREDREGLVAFEASFDFCNVALGVVADPVRKTLESSVWGRYQTPGAERPSHDWVKFFITTLFEHIGPEGQFGVPMFSFVNDTSDLTVVPNMLGRDDAWTEPVEGPEEPAE